MATRDGVVRRLGLKTSRDAAADATSLGISVSTGKMPAWARASLLSRLMLARALAAFDAHA